MNKLKIIATPIGNLGDISSRAISSISSADVILAEDTRSARKLISFLGINLKSQSRIISCHAQIEEQRAHVVEECLKANEQVVLLSDAGCPVISDPGSLLVQAVVKAGFEVEVIPGPSAQSAAIMGAGIDTTRFAFLGFLPKKNSQRKKLFQSTAACGLALVIYESPLRVKNLLDDLFEALGPRRVVVARELTKVFETFHRGVLGQELKPSLVEKGECVVIVEAQDVERSVSNDEKESVVELIKKRSEQAFRTKDIVKELVDNFNIKKNQAYDMVIEYQSSKKEPLS
ncbi:MAG: 16S rRNA (cytidine(1402)-2'-O)-methyltransferase [Myxococcales bacterium]|nr:16S rRNA (cytidine(1402)-2'-O)-methyltransferase [Myxococcales bacterium]USN50149.1 MAG: 16S rRNA (cytidine(1402)-2'-O)-methyltransferase [Myxococcales bacterium]